MNHSSSDPLLKKISEYIVSYDKPNDEALKMARLSLADALGCALLSLQNEDCRRLLGPWVPGTVVPGGCRIPGIHCPLDPVTGAFNLGTMIRFLDYNDTFLAKEWVHPSDAIGALLPLMDYLKGFKVHNFLTALIKTYEIQGGLALENSFNQVGIDHVILVKVAVAGVATHLLGGNETHVIDALSQAFIDLGPLRIYRQEPNTGLRKSWAAGDAAARGLALAFLTMRGEKGYLTPLSTPRFGLEAVLFQNQPLKLFHELGSYIIENILFKISYPAEFHAQTAIEAALLLNPNPEDIRHISIATHAPALSIINKKGPLKNHADRDHCMRYMVAIALLYGHLTADHYHDKVALDPRIDLLREKIDMIENPEFTKNYYNPEMRSIASSMTITLKNGTILGPLTVEFPLGHKNRRKEGIPMLYKKFEQNLTTHFSKERVKKIISLFKDEEQLDALDVSEFMDFFLKD